MSAITASRQESEIFVVKDGRVTECPHNPAICAALLYSCCTEVCRPVIPSPEMTLGILCKGTEKLAPNVFELVLPDGQTLLTGEISLTDTRRPPSAAIIPLL